MSSTGAAAASASPETGEHWLSRPEAGGWFAIWLIRFIGLHLGRGVARLILYPITLYFYFRRGPERRSARDYFRRLTGRPGSAWQIMRLIHAFASTILDRVFLLVQGTRHFRVTAQGEDELNRLLDAGHGALLLGAHVGSFGVLRVLSAQRPECRLKLVMDKSKTPALTTLLESLAPELANDIVDTARGGTDIVLSLAETVREGGMVALLGDRGRPHQPTCDVPFLGAPAAFPASPWLLASALQVPVVLCLGLYRGGNRYDVVFETLAERVVLPRANRDAALAVHVARYAARLEHHLRTAPYNWFNFYDFWLPPSIADAHAAAPDTLWSSRVA